jgi:hypothetical protein
VSEEESRLCVASRWGSPSGTIASATRQVGSATGALLSTERQVPFARGMVVSLLRKVASARSTIGSRSGTISGSRANGRLRRRCAEVRDEEGSRARLGTLVSPSSQVIYADG